MASKVPACRTHTRVPLCASLPPEVWINIFRYHTSHLHLWTSCRRVSTTLRACAEYAFAEHFLADVSIDFQLEKYNLGGKSKRPEVPVSFDRIGKRKEKEVAWFRDKRDKGVIGDGGSRKAQAEYDRVIRRWEENVTGWTPEMPNYTISIGGLVNDTELPGLEIDVEKREVRFKWKEMLQLFFREEERLQLLKERWHARTAKQIQANNAKLANGEKLAASDYPVSWSTAKDEMRKQVRRARLTESYDEDEEMVWAIGSLKHFEGHSAMAGSSKVFSINPDIPGAGLGEKWFGSINLVQGLYLDEWSCMHRIDTKLEHLRSGQ